MRQLSQPVFDIHALALPRGHGFGTAPPFEALESDDGSAMAILTRADDGRTGIILMRRREDQVWAVLERSDGLAGAEEARTQATAFLSGDSPPVPVPPGEIRRAALHDLGRRTPSTSFELMTRSTHRAGLWLLNQLYLALPRPDRNWASDCQTGNFHTRLWEAQLLACLREQGLLVEQPHESPDFRIANARGKSAWVEVVTANPTERFDPVGAMPSLQPDDLKELFAGEPALRFAKTIGSKLQRNYDAMPHVAGHPFAIALADFHAPSSMVWSREALIGYLYSFRPEVLELAGVRRAVPVPVEQLGGGRFPAGLFADEGAAQLSAIIFTNACSQAKLNRIMVGAGADTGSARFVRYGRLADHTEGALTGIEFSLDVGGEEYAALWPQGREPWCAELEVFHNPFAATPLPTELLPEASHWLEIDGQLDNKRFYETGILWSRRSFRTGPTRSRPISRSPNISRCSSLKCRREKEETRPRIPMSDAARHRQTWTSRPIAFLVGAGSGQIGPASAETSDRQGQLGPCRQLD